MAICIAKDVFLLIANAFRSLTAGSEVWWEGVDTLEEVVEVADRRVVVFLAVIPVTWRHTVTSKISADSGRSLLSIPDVVTFRRKSCPLREMNLFRAYRGCDSPLPGNI